MSDTSPNYQDKDKAPEIQQAKPKTPYSLKKRYQEKMANFSAFIDKWDQEGGFFA